MRRGDQCIDSEETNEIRELTIAEVAALGGGRTDVIKAMGNTKWGDEENNLLGLLWLVGRSE